MTSPFPEILNLRNEAALVRTHCCAAAWRDFRPGIKQCTHLATCVGKGSGEPCVDQSEIGSPQALGT
jgi:hypothetical protein